MTQTESERTVIPWGWLSKLFLPATDISDLKFPWPSEKDGWEGGSCCLFSLEGIRIISSAMTRAGSGGTDKGERKKQNESDGKRLGLQRNTLDFPRTRNKSSSVCHAFKNELAHCWHWWRKQVPGSITNQWVSYCKNINYDYSEITFRKTSNF